MSRQRGSLVVILALIVVGALGVGAWLYLGSSKGLPKTVVPTSLIGQSANNTALSQVTLEEETDSINLEDLDSDFSDVDNDIKGL